MHTCSRTVVFTYFFRSANQSTTAAVLCIQVSALKQLELPTQKKGACCGGGGSGDSARIGSTSASRDNRSTCIRSTSSTTGSGTTAALKKNTTPDSWRNGNKNKKTLYGTACSDTKQHAAEAVTRERAVARKNV